MSVRVVYEVDGFTSITPIRVYKSGNRSLPITVKFGGDNVEHILSIEEARELADTLERFAHEMDQGDPSEPWF